MKKDFIWVEKYRPETISECILPDKIEKILLGFIEKKNFPNFIFNGSQGIGKTAAAVAMMKDIKADFIVINGNNEGRLIDTLRSNITNFASSVSLYGGRKYVIIDEADNIKSAGDTVQNALKGFTEKYAHNCGFIFTTNNKYDLIPPLRSRCIEIDFKIPKKDAAVIFKKIVSRLKFILDKEGIDYDSTVLSDLVVKNFPDFRKIINNLQAYSVNGIIDSGILNYGDIDTDVLFKMIKEKDFNGIRKWAVKISDNELNLIFRKIYDSLEKYLKGVSLAQTILSIEDFAYKSTFVADKEISLVAFLVTIMRDIDTADIK